MFNKALADMEEKIMDCWSLVDQLNTLTKGVLEMGLNADQTSNVLIGLSELYQIKFEVLFNQFEQAIQENHKK